MASWDQDRQEHCCGREHDAPTSRTLPYSALPPTAKDMLLRCDQLSPRSFPRCTTTVTSAAVAVTLITAEKVDFFVGPDPEHMSKVEFDEGRVVELNNQAKHAVTNGWSQDRVHLILDYVDVSSGFAPLCCVCVFFCFSLVLQYFCG